MKILGALCVYFVFTLVQAEDWLQFRGPMGSGLSAYSGQAPEPGFETNVIWTAPLPGRGLSSPIIVGDLIFLTACSGAQQEKLHVICLGVGNGARKWERQFWATGRTTCHEKISVAAPTPVSDGHLVFALFSSNDLFCFDANGELIWIRALMRDYPEASNNLGLSSSPIVINQTLVAQVETTSEAFIVGIDTLTGTNRWKISRPRHVNWTSPLAVKLPDGRALIIVQSSKGISALDPATGKSQWEIRAPAETIPSSAIADGILYFPAQGLTALDLKSAAAVPKQLWKSNLLRPATASPIVVGESVFTINDAGVLTCGNRTDGKRKWQLRLKGPITASPVARGTTLFVVNESGLLQIVDAESPEGRILAERDLGETILSTPSIAARNLFVRSDQHLWCFGRP